MGYESKFYIIEKSDMRDSKNNKFYGQIIAMMDMCKMGHASATMKLVEQAPITMHYIYAEDGDTQTIEDKYGDPLKEVDITDLLKALKKDDDGYRRVKPFIAILKAIQKESWRNLGILHYGY